MADRAQIISGAIAGSALVHISAPDRDPGTDVLVYAGPDLLGSADLAAGVADVVLSRVLVAGEVIQASLVNPGDGCGLPVFVSSPGIVIGGWRTPSELDVTLPDGSTISMPADQFKEQFGYLPASIQDPAGVRANVYPEFLPEQLRSIQFSLTIKQVPGQTYVTVSNVTGTLGTPLVQWAASEPFGSDMSRVFAVNTALNLAVKGANDTTPATRNLNIEVTAASSGPSSGDINGLAFRFNNGPYVRVLANSVKQLQARLQGFIDWQNFNFEESQYQECFFQGVPNGPYTIQVRVANDTNSANWKSLTITKS